MFSSSFGAISFFNPLKDDLVGEIPRMTGPSKLGFRVDVAVSVKGDKKSIITTENPEISNFVYASEFMKEIRQNIQNTRS